MKKMVSILLSAIMLFAMLIVPVNIVSAVADGYVDYYAFSFSPNSVYSYTSLIKGNEAAGTLTFTNASGVDTSTVVPLYGSTNYVNNWADMKAVYESIEIDGTTCGSLNVISNNDAVLVPITSEGKPFELAPGHTYTVNIAYTHTGNGTNDSWYAKRGLYLGGGLYPADIDSNKHARQFASVTAFGAEAVASMPYGVKIDDLLDIDSTGIIEKTVTFSTPSENGTGYTYDAEKNAYTATVTYTSASGGGVVGSTVELDFYNYFYLYFDHYGTSEINITSLEIIRDDFTAETTVEYIDEDGTVLKTVDASIGDFTINYTPVGPADKQFLGWHLDAECTVPAGSVVNITSDGIKLYAKWGESIDWSSMLEDKYVFDFSNDGYYADVPNKQGQSVIDSSKNWTYAPVSFDPGNGRVNRNIYPVYSNASTAGWGPQTWAEPSSFEYNNETYESYKVSNLNPSIFVPLKEDGTPFEMAPGHSYSVKASFYVNSYESGSPMLQCDVGVTPDGTLKMNSQTSMLDTTVASVRIGWISSEVGQLVEKNFTITVPSAYDSDFEYNNAQNTFTKNVNGVDYTLYNYLCFSLTNYGKPVVEFVSLEITRDDYVATGTVEYIDEDGSVLKSEVVSAGEYAINFIPENTDEKYFQGWYTDEALTKKVTSAKLPMSADGLKIYAKWEEYKTSIESVDPTYYYGVGFAPNLTAAGVYSHQTSTRSSVSATTVATTPDKLTLSTSFWGDGILLTAVADNTGEIFRAKPNTAYRISLKFRITEESTKADGVDVAVAAGAGLPDTNSNYPMGKYWDENNLKSRLAYTNYNEVTEEGKYVTYTALFTTEEFTTIPAIGVELWLYNGATVEIYSLSVAEFDGETLADGEFFVSKEVENRTTYMVKFDYSLIGTPSNDIGIGFKTTASDTIGYPTYIEGEDVAIYTVSADKTVGEWYSATTLITTDMTATVVNSYGCDDVITALNTNLYGYVIGEEKNLVTVKNVTVKKLTDLSGNNLIDAKGGQCLTSEAEAAAGQQALRYSFSYDTVTGNEIIIDGKEYTVKERGFIYVNGNNYAKGGIYNADFNLTNAKAGKFLYNSKKNNLDICWKHSAIGDTGYSNLIFSTYVKDFEINDTKELMVKAFVVIEIDGQEFTVYSDTVNRSVAYLKSLA